MIRRSAMLAAAASLAVSGCSSMEGRTTAEGAGLGAAGGALLGYALGGRQGAVQGAAIGLGVGAVAGAYVAKQKKKYATIEKRIAGEREIALAAISNARVQVASSRAQLQVLERQLADLKAARRNSRQALQSTSTMLTRLSQQQSQLQAQQAQLLEQIENQKAFIADTEQQVRRRGNRAQADQRAQLDQWRADIPKMQAALASMTDQIGEVRSMESRVERVRKAYA